MAVYSSLKEVIKAGMKKNSRQVTGAESETRI